jgi:hypothetical protein
MASVQPNPCSKQTANLILLPTTSDNVLHNVEEYRSEL